MTARNVSLEATVSRVGTNRWRPAQATGSPSAPRMTTPRSTPGGWPRACIAPPTCSEAGHRGRHRHAGAAARDQDMNAPRHLKTLVADEVRFILERDSRLLVPVGTCEQHGPHLPLGCDTIIVERLADDLSASFDILRAPTIEYGVNTATQRPYAGNATVRRKTLHRWMNDLLGSWEQTGVDAFIILTAHGHDPHQEALSTLRTRRARVFTVDVFALDFGGHLA